MPTNPNDRLNQLSPWIVVLSLSLLGVLSHLIPHPAGMSTVGAVGMLAAALLPRKLLAIPVFVTITVFDLYHGGYALVAMMLVYAAHVAAAGCLPRILVRINTTTVIGAALASALVFYLISNLAPMVLGFYPNSAAGWVSCYVNGIPFLLRGIAANLIFGGLAFLILWAARRTADFIRDRQHFNLP